eukprot:scaffold4907_cov122-Isochrysis_galbana.AAC.10
MRASPLSRCHAHLCTQLDPTLRHDLRALLVGLLGRAVAHDLALDDGERRHVRPVPHRVGPTTIRPIVPNIGRPDCLQARLAHLRQQLAERLALGAWHGGQRAALHLHVFEGVRVRRPGRGRGRRELHRHPHLEPFHVRLRPEGGRVAKAQGLAGPDEPAVYHQREAVPLVLVHLGGGPGCHVPDLCAPRPELGAQRVSGSRTGIGHRRPPRWRRAAGRARLGAVERGHAGAEHCRPADLE